MRKASVAWRKTGGKVSDDSVLRGSVVQCRPDKRYAVDRFEAKCNKFGRKIIVTDIQILGKQFKAVRGRN